MIQINKLEYKIEERLILDNINLSINDYEKIGLVGVNGAGKSTLLKLIAKKLEPESGNILIKGTYAYLEQEIASSLHDLNFPNCSIEEYLVLEKGLDIHNWEINRYLNLMNITDKDCDSDFSSLSGGQKVKVEIIALLHQEPDLLILDEPTNFLDIPTAEWLMKYLMGYKKSVLAVSHDLRLMNKAINRIWFLNELTHKVESFNGNYTEFLDFKEKSNALLAKDLKEQEKRNEKLYESAQQLSSRKSSAEKSRAAKLMRKALAEREALKEKKAESSIKSSKMKVQFEIRRPTGRKVLEVKNISKKFEKDVLKNINLEIIKGEKVIVIGRNGIGKSTLLKLIADKMKPDKGEITIGHNVDMGYYAQEFDGLNYDQTLIENFLSDKVTSEFGELQIRRILSMFLFRDERLDQKVQTLSGGEKTRLALAKLMSRGDNFLVLDEPTTYLDPASVQILLEALKKFKGTLLLVSHLPEFVKELKPDKVLLLPEERFTHYCEDILSRVRDV